MFTWNEKTNAAAIGLAEGKTVAQVASEAEVDERTIYRWKNDIEFSAEVDRLSLMVGIASRAERLRLTQRVIRQKISDEGLLDTDKDLLDWIKFAQSETDGVKLDLSKLAALGETNVSLADRRQARTAPDRTGSAESGDQGSPESGGSRVE